MMGSEPLNLDASGEWAGLWWLPEDPGCQVPGVLRYEPEGGLTLSLIGAFEDRVTTTPAPGVLMVHEGRRTWGVIHGAADQREISLLGCLPVDGRRTFGARIKTPDKQTVVATTALIGAHVGSEDEAAFSTTEVSVEDLGHWAASSVFEGFLGTSGGRPDGSGTLSVKPVEVQSVEVDGTEFVLAHRHTLPFFDQRRGGTVGRMRDTAYLRITRREASSLREAMGHARLIQDLIAIATHRAAGMIWVRLKLASDDAVSESGGLRPERNVDVLYSPSVVGKHDAKAAAHHRVFFTCEALPFEEIIPRWCDMHERLQSATNMVLGLRYAPARYVENNLLTAVGAAEVLHRGFDIDESPIPSEEFKPMREAMLAQVPEEHRQRIRSLLRNDPTLRDRLYALAARPDQEALSALVPDVDRWARRTTRARNDLAHEGRTPHHKREELIAIVDVTTAVVILNLLNELGLPAERQREVVRDHPQLRATARSARDWLTPSEADS
ncbi:HEPN domain-containing protein [Streptomyces sp. NPDC048196]|uniref:ApeA N-terminal domain 1-containing protein n=1 Tax=Streptomyces sp. NPDC048196 TaxID=3154712 RepID=UPI0034084A33